MTIKLVVAIAMFGAVLWMVGRQGWAADSSDQNAKSDEKGRAALKALG